MVDSQEEPNEENVHNIQFSDQATEAEATETDSTNNSEGNEASPEKKVHEPLTPNQQAIFDREINRQLGKNHEIADELKSVKAQLSEAHAKVPQAEAPEIPAMPDPDDFYGDPNGLKAAQDARDKAISERAKFDTSAEQQTKFQADQTFKQQQEQIQKQNETMSSYAETADTFGIKGEQMQKDALAVSQSLSPDIQDFIVKDAQGPLVSNYLAKNILELDKLRSMTPMQAAIHIETEIRPKLAGIKKTTKTPMPPDIDEGQGVPDKIDKRLEGVVFE